MFDKIILKRLVKTVFVLFWLILIFLFLYFPNFLNYADKTKSINIYTWPDFLQHEQIIPFEKMTGIKVNVNYYENNNEIFTKLNLTKGEGIDLVLMTDDAVKKVIDKGLAKKIDISKIKDWQDIRKEFRNLPYDKNSEYAIPYSWDIYGIGYSKKAFDYSEPIKSWKLLFDPAIKHVAMVNEPFEIISIASQYLYQANVELDTERLEEIKNLLLEQKKWVEAYTDLRVDYLLSSGTSPVGVTQSAYMKRAMESSDDIAFLIPKEGSFLVVDSFIIPEAAQNLDEIYSLLNYLNRAEQLKDLTEDFGYLPVRDSVLKETDLSYMGNLEDLLSPERFKKFGFFYQTLPETVINRFWIDIKSR